MKLRICYFTILFLLHYISGYGQSFEDSYKSFKQNAIQKYDTFRKECIEKYIEFLKEAWDWYDGKAPLPFPKDEQPVPPQPYVEEDAKTPIAIVPIEVSPIKETPQPIPIEPIQEVPIIDEKYFSLDFYGISCKVRLPDYAKSTIQDCSPGSLLVSFLILCDDEMVNALSDCLDIRNRYNLCDWAYLLFLYKLSKQYCTNKNSATLLMAYLYCLSGYQMRLGIDNDDLIMLYGSKHTIFNKSYFTIDGINFYPFGITADSISICNAPFEGETPMSLYINQEQLLGDELSAEREIQSESYKDLIASSQVPQNLIAFYNEYPTSMLDGNDMTRWAMYANTPLAQKTKEKLYPSLKTAIKDLSEEKAVNKILNWVQTGFIYEYDDKVWGHDRAFFAEETLYYPYCDCEDRSILFSRLVRDLVGLEVALIYYPGHLATAVRFTDDVEGDAMLIKDSKYVVCDPTYIGAPVGVQMPNLEYDKTQAIVLRK